MLLIPLAVRVGWEGRAELERADEAAQAANIDREIEHLGRAARWRLPGLRYDDIALERLVALAEQQEARGDVGTQSALAAYRETRRALLSTRTFGVPQPDLFDRVNERIATLMAAQEARFDTDVSGTGDPYTYHLQLLDETPGPDPWQATLAALAFVGWLVSVAGFVLRALDARGRLRPGAAVRWGGACLLLLVAWTVLLRFAG
jgi:hypothetical protein